MKIIEVKRRTPDFQYFENLPRQLYPADSLRHRQGDSIDQPFLQRCFVALEDQRPLARVALFNNPKLFYAGQKAACLGHYEAMDNPIVAQALLRHALQEARNTGAGFVLGPMNGSTWENYRFGTDRDQGLFFSEPCHPLYYNDHFKSAGMKTVADYYSSAATDLSYNYTGLEERAEEFRQQGLRLRNIDLGRYIEELEKIHAFNAKAFKSNFLYTPIPKSAFIKKYLSLQTILDPEFVILAEDAQGDLKGYFLGFRDLYHPQGNAMIIKTIARHPDPQWRGLGQVIGREFYRRVGERGYSSIIHAFMYEQGTSANISNKFSGTIYKHYALYGTAI